MAQRDGGDFSEHIHQKTVVAQVMEKIKELITSGLYKVGDKIPTEQELAERFGIGRSSIREAIKIFQYLGILESRVPKGTFLCGRSQISTEAIAWAVLLGDDDMWEILELRQVIEEKAFLCVVSRLAGDRTAREGFARRLQEQVDEMRLAAEEHSIERLNRADYTFHAAIIEEGGNKLFRNIYGILHSFMREEIFKTYEAMEDLGEVSRDHQEIVDMVMRGGPERAAARHGAHFSRIKGLLAPDAKGKM